MNKYKIVTKAGMTQLIVKSLKGQQIKEHEVYAINNDDVRGLLHLDVIRKGSGFRLVYQLTGYIPLKQFLLTPLNKETFADILQNIVDIMNSMKAAFFNTYQLMMNFDCVMVNPAQRTLYFVYLPIQNLTPTAVLRDFLQGIVQYATFSKSEDTSYIKDYIAILNSGVAFSQFELEQYIISLTGRKKPQPEGRICPRCRCAAGKTAVFCPDCGLKLTGQTSSSKYIYDPADNSGQAEKPIPVTAAAAAQPAPRSVPEEKEQGGTTVLGDTTTIGGTTILSDNIPQGPKGYLVRQKNEERIDIDADAFRIGHGQVGYDVTDNTAVSRKHADILTRDGHFFIIDLGSTNGTFIDDRRITPDTEMELYSGTRVRFANEDYMFYIE